MRRKWPQYVYKTNKGYIIWREYLGKIDGKYKFARDVRLGKAPMSDREVWKAYVRVTEQATDTLGWLLGRYHESAQYKRLSDKTKEEYEGYRIKIENKPVKSYGTFGKTPYSLIRKTTIRLYLDSYTDKHGNWAPIAANRHVQYLKAAYNWAGQRFDTVRNNPCEKVTLNEQKPRTRYVDDEEYTVAITLAMDSGSPYLAAFMELAVLCRARRSEVSALTLSKITDEGIILSRLKGSQGEVTTWTKRLEGAVSYARSLHSSAPVPISGQYLIHDKHGQPIKKSAFNSAWRRLMDKVEAKGIPRFTYHDLKAKGVTDHKDHAGVSEAMLKIYNRKLKRVEATS